MMKLQYKRYYDKYNRLIREILDTEETIIKYDDRNNIIYKKNWNIKSGEIWYEYYQSFDDHNRMIYFKDTENGQEFSVKYNSNVYIEEKQFSNGEYIKYIYDEENNVILEISNEDTIEFINIYED